MSWRVGPGSPVELASVDTRAPDGTDRTATEAATDELGEELDGLQERLWAEGSRSLLVVLQAMDAGGKDGTIRKVFTGLNPHGVRVTSFGPPTEEELKRDFLWRVHANVPRRGEIGIFNRSHYEDVLIVRVEELAPEIVWRDRYRQIRDFEHLLTQGGTKVVKLFLHISPEEQQHRFEKRKREKPWKWNDADLTASARWDDYRTAYVEAIVETDTVDAPWHVVPADDKWYRNYVVRSLLVDAMREMDPQLPR